jgi:hypothetical protein
MPATHRPHATNAQERDQLAVAIEAWLDRVRRDRSLLPNAFHVAYEISLHFNREHIYETGELLAWPAVDTIKTGTGLARNTVLRMLDALIDAGHLGKEAGLGRSNQNHYRGLFERVPQVGTLSTEHVSLKKGQSKTRKSPKIDDKESHLAGTQPAELPADGSHLCRPVEIPAKQHTHVNGRGGVGERGQFSPYAPGRLDDGSANGHACKLANSRTARIAALQSEFDRWWDIFPKRPGLTSRNRELAFREFRKVRAEGITLDWLVTQAHNYDNQESANPNPDPMFIVAPENWPKHRRFEDEYTDHANRGRRQNG